MRVMLAFFVCFFYTLIVGNNFSNEFVDSMVIATDHHLYDRPAFGKDYEVAKLRRGEIIHVLEKVKFSDLKGRDRNFIKINNITGDTGYVVDWALISSAVYKKQLDSLSEWKKKAQPSLDSMRGKPCLDGNHVNNEVELTFPWNYLGKNKKYATISAANNYNPNFWYLLLVSSPDSANIVMDIIPVNLTDYPKGTEFEFNHCGRGNESYDTSGVISLLYADPDKYKPGKLVKPFKSWKANLKTKRINEISVIDINCRQQDPEERYNGP